MSCLVIITDTETEANITTQPLRFPQLIHATLLIRTPDYFPLPISCTGPF